jgi:predicted DNA-binding transcriptional regulator AlpA
MTAHQPITAGQVAELLGVSGATVRRHWPRWHRAQGFPKPLELTGIGRVLLRWDEAGVQAWKAMRGGATQAEVDNVEWALIARSRGEALLRGEDPDGIGR